MTVTHTPGTIKKFRRTSWRFQQTVERPEVSDLERFVSTIFRAEHHIEAATVTIDEVVFDTERMLREHKVAFQPCHRATGITWLQAGSGLAARALTKKGM